MFITSCNLLCAMISFLLWRTKTFCTSSSDFYWWHWFSVIGIYFYQHQVTPWAEMSSNLTSSESHSTLTVSLLRVFLIFWEPCHAFSDFQGFGKMWQIQSHWSQMHLCVRSRGLGVGWGQGAAWVPFRALVMLQHRKTCPASALRMWNLEVKAS